MLRPTFPSTHHNFLACSESQVPRLQAHSRRDEVEHRDYEITVRSHPLAANHHPLIDPAAAVNFRMGVLTDRNSIDNDLNRVRQSFHLDPTSNELKSLLGILLATQPISLFATQSSGSSITTSSLIHGWNQWKSEFDRDIYRGDLACDVLANTVATMTFLVTTWTLFGPLNGAAEVRDSLFRMGQALIPPDDGLIRFPDDPTPIDLLSLMIFARELVTVSCLLSGPLLIAGATSGVVGGVTRYGTKSLSRLSLGVIFSPLRIISNTLEKRHRLLLQSEREKAVNLLIFGARQLHQENRDRNAFLTQRHTVVSMMKLLPTDNTVSGLLLDEFQALAEKAFPLPNLGNSDEMRRELSGTLDRGTSSLLFPD